VRGRATFGLLVMGGGQTGRLHGALVESLKGEVEDGLKLGAQSLEVAQ
jgi:hypothetical protein